MVKTKKITAELPAVLLSKATAYTGASITETLRQGLERLATSKAYEDFLALEGKVKFSIDYKTLREDRT